MKDGLGTATGGEPIGEEPDPVSGVCSRGPSTQKPEEETVVTSARCWVAFLALPLASSPVLAQDCPSPVVSESEPNDSTSMPDHVLPSSVILGAVSTDSGSDPVDVYFLEVIFAEDVSWALLPENPSASVSIEFDPVGDDPFVVAGQPGEVITGTFDAGGWAFMDAYVRTSGAATNYAFYFEMGTYSCFRDCNGNGIADEVEFDLTWSRYCYCAVSGCGTSDAFAGCPNSTDVGALLTPCNSGSVGADDLILTVSSVPPNQFGILFMGSAQTDLPFGNGRLCIDVGGLGAYRFPVHNSGSLGVLREGPGMVGYSQANFGVFGAISVGQAWHFQGWYRDPGGPCGSTFNLSNGLSIVFGP